MLENKVAIFLIGIYLISITSAGLSPVHDLKAKMNSKIIGESFLFNSPHKVLKHLDNSILKATKNVTQNPQMEDTLYHLSKSLVSAILSKLEVQDKITRITKEALEAPGKLKGITAIETRRILDYISRTISGHILSITKESTEPELHRLVYGLGQIAAEVSIVSALKDITYATSLSKKQSIDLSLRKKRSIGLEADIKATTIAPEVNTVPSLYTIILNHTPSQNKIASSIIPPKQNSILIPASPYSVSAKKLSLRVINTKNYNLPTRGFLNQTVLDNEKNDAKINESEAIVLEKALKGVHEIDPQKSFVPDDEDTYPLTLTDDWLDTNYKTAINSDIAAQMEMEEFELQNEKNEKKAKQKLERLEVKAKKAILYAGDVAFLTAASVVAMRRALTASIEVQMSVKYAKNGMSNHQDLMMNLAKTAAQQAGKEAKSATSKALACERVIKLAVKYTAQSHGAKLNHVANRIVMDTLSLATLAKSMAFVSSEIAINSLYEATDVKPPS